MSVQWVQILAAAIAGCGFAVMFHIHPKHLPLIFFGAGLSWFAFLLAEKTTGSRSMGMIVSAMAVTIYSEIFARVVKMPVSVIYSPAIIPLIPGSHLYYCMRGFVTDSHADFIKYGEMLMEDSLGIVLGSLIVLTFVSAITSRKRKARN